jgi:quinol monooxygenase YgiN
MSSDDQSITVMGHARAKGGHEADVRAGLHAFISPARQESGCISYELFEDVQYTGSFYTVEKWENQDALDLHVKGQQPDMNKLLPWLSDQLRISVVKSLE